MSEDPGSSSEREIYVAASRIDNDTERDAFLAEACTGQPRLKERVERLLAAQERRSENLLRQAVKNSASEAVNEIGSTVTQHGTEDPSTKLPGFDIDQHPIIDRYKMLEEIGRGGMGTVYMAQQTEPVRRRVAVKVINPGMDSREVLARFEAERQALALMDHPNIARVLDGGTTENGLPYFVMELVRGVSIMEYCRQKKLGLRSRLELFVNVCSAVQHAHQKGIIHRDLKPGNLLVTMHDDKPVVKVIDFGVAKALSFDLTDRTLFTQFSAMIGTPLYMSPEQAQMSGLDVDTRSDVYSLGVLLYEMLTDTTPFDRKVLANVGFDGFRKLLTDEEPQRPSLRISTLKAANLTTVEDQRQLDVQSSGKELERELDWIVLKALEKDRERRYESAAAFADDIRRFLNHEPVAACPPTVGYRFRKWLNRNRISVAVGALVLIVLLFVTGMSLWQARQVSEAWAESQMREREVTNLLDASQLQSALSAFRQSAYHSIPELLSQRNAAFAPKIDCESESRYFHNVLLDIANPDPDEISHVGTGFADLSWDAANDTVWGVDSLGGFYRVEQWNPAAGSTEPQSTQPTGSVFLPTYSIAVSPDGSRLAIGTAVGLISIWSVEGTVSELHRFSIGSNGVETIAWSPDGAYLAAGSRYEAFWVGRANGEKLFRIANDHRHESLVFHSKRQEIFVPTREGIDVYTLPDGKKTRSINTEPHINPREIMLTGPDDNRLLVSSRFSETILILDPATGRKRGKISLLSRYPQSMAVWRKGSRLAVLLPTGMLQIFHLGQNLRGDVAATPIISFPVTDRNSTLEENTRLRVTPPVRGNKLITSVSGNAVQRWNLDRILPLQILNPPSPVAATYPIASDELAYFYCSGFSREEPDIGRATPIGIGKPATHRDGEKLPIPLLCFSRHVSRQGWVACAGPNSAGVYDLSSGTVVLTFDTPVVFPSCVEISQQGDAIVIQEGNDSPGMMAWRSEDEWQTFEPSVRSDARVRGVLCFAERNDQTFLLWDESSDRIHECGLTSGERRILAERSDNSFTTSATSADGTLLAIGHRDKLEVLDLTTGAQRFQVTSLSAVRVLEFMPGGRILLSGHDSGQVHGWHIPTGQALGILLEGNRGLGVPDSMLTFPNCHRLLIGYRSEEDSLKLTPVIIGTDKVVSRSP